MNDLIFYTCFILAKTFLTGGLLQEVYYNIHRCYRKVTVFSTSCLQFHLVAHRSEALIGWALRWGGRNVIHYGLRWEEGLFDSTLFLSLTICSIRVHCAVFSCYLHYLSQMAAYKLVLIRHGESCWNQENRFCGWFDADLSETGSQEAKKGGQALKGLYLIYLVQHCEWEL